MIPDGNGAGSAPLDGQEAGQPAADVADYIADLAAQLAVLARSKDFELIAYLLEMARMEATNTARRLSPSS